MTYLVSDLHMRALVEAIREATTAEERDAAIANLQIAAIDWIPEALTRLDAWEASEA